MSAKIDNYEYCTSEEILLPDQSRLEEQAEFTYYLLRKSLEKQTKTIENQGGTQIHAIMDQNERQIRFD